MSLAQRIGGLLTLLAAGAAGAGNARLLTSDAAEPILRPVLGLQRSALPLGLGVALDTALLADLALAPNLGLRWAHVRGGHRFVAGARYTYFAGTRVYSDAVASQEPLVTRFEPRFSGPSAYGLYGYQLGRVLLQGEARYTAFDEASLGLTAAAVVQLGRGWGLVVEAGARLRVAEGFKGAAGFRYQGRHLGASLGVAYVDLRDPLVPGRSLPILPAFDLAWSF